MIKFETRSRSRTSQRGVRFHELIEAILGPYRSPTVSRTSVHLGERVTNSFVLIFHTMATNSAKYSALSLGGGAVRVSWETTDDNLSLHWHENGVRRSNSQLRKGLALRSSRTRSPVRSAFWITRVSRGVERAHRHSYGTVLALSLDALFSRNGGRDSYVARVKWARSGEQGGRVPWP
jgi:hypothetical protein